MHWIYYAIIGLCLVQFMLYFISRYRERKFRQFLQAQDRLMQEKIGSLMKHMRFSDAKSLLRWIDKNQYERLVGEQWIKRDTLHHTTLDEMIEQYVNETTAIKIS